MVILRRHSLNTFEAEPSWGSDLYGLLTEPQGLEALRIAFS